MSESIPEPLNNSITFKFEDAEIQRKLITLQPYAANLSATMPVPPMYTTLRCNTLTSSPQEVVNLVKSQLKQVESSRNVSFEVCIHPTVSDLIVIKNEGPIPRTKMDKQVVVDRFCGTAVLRGSDIYAQGVLAMSPDVCVGDLVSVYIDVDGECLKGSKPPFTFRRYFAGNGISKYSRKEIFSSNSAASNVGIEMNEPIYVAPSLNNFLSGVVFSQNLPSALCAHILLPNEEDMVLDMCAAPGGKTCHLASLMQNRGSLIALEKAKSKINKLKANLSASGITNCRVYCADSSTACSADAVDINAGPPYPPGSFDKILLDAPCSALGQRPCLLNKMTFKELSSYASLQKKLINAAVKLLKPGGLMVYSTCTFNPDENELQIEWLLQQFPFMTLESQGEYHVNTLIPPAVTCTLPEDQVKLLQWFYPGNIPYKQSDPYHYNYNFDTIGFFIAKLRKKNS